MTSILPIDRIEKETDGGAVAQLLWQFRAGENGGGFDKFCEDEKSEKKPKSQWYPETAEEKANGDLTKQQRRRQRQQQQAKGTFS